MPFFILFALLLISASNILELKMQAAAHISGQVEPACATLDSLRHRSRPLLVFAPDDTDARFVRQMKLLADGAASLQQRQVLFVPLLVKQRAEHPGGDALERAEFSRKDAAEARRQFHIALEEFAVILIGKDGGEKFRAHTPVTIERLNTLIDAMPMRQQELRNGNSK